MFIAAPVTSPFPGIALEDTAARSRAVVCPSRGALVSHLDVGGVPLLYLDEATLLDTSKNVRGGIPVLFPSPGKLTGDRYDRGGVRGQLAQHGFARNKAWSVVGDATDSSAAVTLALESDAQTRANYPFEFRVELTFRLSGSVFRIEQRVQNRGATAMPFGMGFHPYFAVPQGSKAGARIATRATRAWDNAAKREIPLVQPIDLTAPEVDLHFLDHGSSSSAVTWDSGGRSIALSGSPEFTRWVVWTLAGKDFVCLEPWTCPGDALNTGQGLIELAAGGERCLWIEIRG